MSPTIVLVHGSWAGAWCFDRVIELLAERGLASIAPDLPGHGDNSLPVAGLHENAHAVRRLLDGLSAPVVLLGHSSGGTVITEAAADHPTVSHLVYLCAFMPDIGESLMTLNASISDPDVLLIPGESLILRPDGTSVIDPSAALELFYGDCEPEDAELAATRLGPDHLDVATEAPTAAAWHQTPSTYVICTQDRALSPQLQRRLAERATASVQWPTSHSPYLSRPDLLAELLTDIAARCVSR